LKKLALWSSAALIACSQGAENESPLETRSQAIVQGAADATNEAVGIVDVGGGVWATGFMIAPNVVLTSATMVSGTRKPIAFYTGAGTATPSTGTKPDAATLAGLVKHTVKSFGGHPMAVVPEPYPTTGNYPYQYDIAYVVLDEALSTVPFAYGNPVAAGAVCTTVGYGADGVARYTGNIGSRRFGQVTVQAIYDATKGLILVGGGPGLSNQGDAGSPLVCGGNVVGSSSLFHSTPSEVLYETMYQSTSVVKTWIDGVVHNNPPPVKPVVMPEATLQLQAVAVAAAVRRAAVARQAKVTAALAGPIRPPPPKVGARVLAAMRRVRRVTGRRRSVLLY
jgi:hypothetical protein